MLSCVSSASIFTSCHNIIGGHLRLWTLRQVAHIIGSCPPIKIMSRELCTRARTYLHKQLSVLYELFPRFKMVCLIFQIIFTKHTDTLGGARRVDSNFIAYDAAYASIRCFPIVNSKPSFWASRIDLGYTILMMADASTRALMGIQVKNALLQSFVRPIVFR
jgi:hypothetical protein